MKMTKDEVKNLLNEVLGELKAPHEDNKNLVELISLVSKATKFFRIYEPKSRRGLNEWEKNQINNHCNALAREILRFTFEVSTQAKDSTEIAQKDVHIRKGKDGVFKVYKTKYGLVVERI